MKYVRGSNWIIAGLLSAACFAALVLLLHMWLLLAGGLAVLVFVGSIFFFMPSKYVVEGIDITKAHNKNKAEKDIERWMKLVKELRQVSDSGQSAYLSIKASQMIDVASCVFDSITNDVACLPIAQRFCERYLMHCLTVAKHYRQVDKAADATGGDGYQKQKETLRDEMETLIAYFGDHLTEILSGDGKELAVAIRMVSESKEPEVGR